MTSVDWKACSCRTTSDVKISDVEAYVKGPLRGSLSPIDQFYTANTGIVQAATPALLSAHPSMGALLMVGLVSATENYFRDVLSQIVSWCPIARDASAQERISLGTVLWHDGRLFARGFFEHVSFTSSENVRSTVRKFTGHDIKRHGALDVALAEYDKICELRHGVVHSGGVIAGKNALMLALRAASPESTISVGFAELQESAAVCTTVVAAANAELFVEMVTRWATKWRKHRAWDATRDKKMFRGIWETFFSEIDAQNKQTPVVVSRRKCMNLVRKQFRL